MQSVAQLLLLCNSDLSNESSSAAAIDAMGQGDALRILNAARYRFGYAYSVFE